MMVASIPTMPWRNDSNARSMSGLLGTGAVVMSESVSTRLPVVTRVGHANPRVAFPHDEIQARVARRLRDRVVPKGSNLSEELRCEAVLDLHTRVRRRRVDARHPHGIQRVES